MKFKKHLQWIFLLLAAALPIAVALLLVLLIKSNSSEPTSVEESGRDIAPFTNTIGMEMLPIPGGSFMMGGAESQSGRPEELPAHRVSIKPFFMSRFEVTQAQWSKIMGRNPSRHPNQRRPVEQISWLDAQAFIHQLNETEGNGDYRLPTEAEWEYAARAGKTGPYPYEGGVNTLADYAWFARSEEHTSELQSH